MALVVMYGEIEANTVVAIRQTVCMRRRQPSLARGWQSRRAAGQTWPAHDGFDPETVSLARLGQHRQLDTITHVLVEPMHEIETERLLGLLNLNLDLWVSGKLKRTNLLWAREEGNGCCCSSSCYSESRLAIAE